MRYLKLYENYKPMYQEIEFVCYNTKTYSTTLKINQLNLYYDLLKLGDDVLPYMQDFSDESHEQRSLAAILFDKSLFRKIEELASKNNIDVDNDVVEFDSNGRDVKDNVPEWKVNEILQH